MRVSDSQSCKQILAQPNRSHQAGQAGLGLEYLRLAGVPTLAWIASSSALLALQRYREKDLNQFGYSVALVTLATAFGALLICRNRLTFTIRFLSDGIVLTLTASLWGWISPSSNLLQLLTYALLLYGAFATVIGMSSLSDLSLNHSRSIPSSDGEDNSPDSNSAEAASTEIASAPSTHKFSWNWIAVVLLVGFVLYMVIAPALSMAIDHFTPRRSTRELTDMSFLEHLRLQSVSGIMMLLFLATGASIGSFLNVVIFRLPRRRALLWPPSACPNCGYKIKGTDNLPILAWIGLRGRCRQCHVPISIRYPVIEATVAAVFVVFFYVLLLSGGQNLPVREPNFYRGIVWIILYTKWDLVTMYFFHMSIFAILLAWAMINWDRFRVPKTSAIGCILLTIILIAILPHLNPIVSRQTSVVSFMPSGLWVAISGAAIGGIAGLLLQNLFNSPIAATPTADAPPVSLNEPREFVDAQIDASVVNVDQVIPAISSDAPVATAQIASIHADLYGTIARQPASMTDAAFSLALLGAAFGPQAALSIMLIVLATQAIAVMLHKFRGQTLRVPVTLTLFVVAVLHTAVWRQSSNLPIPWWPTPEASTRTIAIWSATTTLGLVVLASLKLFLRPQSSSPTSSKQPTD